MPGNAQRLTVRVTPRARQRRIETSGDGTLVVKVTEPAEGGRANAAVIEMLAELFHVPKRAVTIVRGRVTRHKLIEISPDEKITRRERAGTARYRGLA